MKILERFFWNHYAKSYDNLLRHYRPYQDLLQEVCGHIDSYAKGRSLRILDVGCGTGNYSMELSRRGHSVIGVDFSPSMLTRAKQKMDNGSGVPQFLFSDLNRTLPFREDCFDAIVCINVLYALPDKEGLLAELRRVARRPSLVMIVTAGKPLSLWRAVKLQWQMTEGINRIQSLLALASVGVWNIPIARRQQRGSYQPTPPDEIKELLISFGVWPLWIYETYVNGVLAMGWWKKP